VKNYQHRFIGGKELSGVLIIHSQSLYPVPAGHFPLFTPQSD